MPFSHCYRIPTTGLIFGALAAGSVLTAVDADPLFLDAMGIAADGNGIEQPAGLCGFSSTRVRWVSRVALASVFLAFLLTVQLAKL